MKLNLNLFGFSIGLTIGREPPPAPTDIRVESVVSGQESGAEEIDTNPNDFGTTGLGLGLVEQATGDAEALAWRERVLREDATQPTLFDRTLDEIAIRGMHRSYVSPGIFEYLKSACVVDDKDVVRLTPNNRQRYRDGQELLHNFSANSDLLVVSATDD